MFRVLSHVVPNDVLLRLLNLLSEAKIESGTIKKVVLVTIAVGVS